MKSDSVTGTEAAVVVVWTDGATVVGTDVVRANGPAVVGTDGPPVDIDAAVVEAAGKDAVVGSLKDVVAVEASDATATDVVVVIGMVIGGM